MSLLPFQFRLRTLLLAITGCAVCSWLFTFIVFPIMSEGRRKDLPPAEEAVLAALEQQGFRFGDRFTCSFSPKARAKIQRFIDDGTCHVVVLELQTNRPCTGCVEELAKLPRLQRLAILGASENELQDIRSRLERSGARIAATRK